MSNQNTPTEPWSPRAPTCAQATSPPDRLVDELVRSLRGVGLVVSASLGAWAEAAQLQVVDAHVLLALSDPDRPTDAIELSARSGVSLEALYPALHRLIGRGFVHEEHRRNSLTDAGQGLIASLELARRKGTQSYVAQLSPDELQRLESVLGSR